MKQLKMEEKFIEWASYGERDGDDGKRKTMWDEWHRWSKKARGMSEGLNKYLQCVPLCLWLGLWPRSPPSPRPSLPFPSFASSELPDDTLLHILNESVLPCYNVVCIFCYHLCVRFVCMCVCGADLHVWCCNIMIWMLCVCGCSKVLQKNPTVFHSTHTNSLCVTGCVLCPEKQGSLIKINKRGFNGRRRSF